MSPEDKPSKTEDRHETLRTIGRQGSRVSLAILLSRLFGFLRDMLIAERFGTGAMADLFYVAYRIPNMLRELFAEGALSSAFIPTLTRTLDREGRDEAERLYTGVFLLLTLILLPVILGGMLFAPEILSLLAPGWSIDPDRKDLGSLMIRIMFPFLYFISLSALIMGVYNAQKRFFLPAASPIAFSLALIAATLLPDSLLPGPPILRLALGVLAGGLSQWGVQWLLLGENRLHIVDVFSVAKTWQNPRVRGVMARILPAVGGLWVTQGNLLIATLFGSYLATGTIAALYYAMRLVQFPLGLIGAAVATVILPLFSLHARDGTGPQEKLAETLAHGYRASLFLMLPASAGLIALREPLIRLLFQHGHFNSTSAVQTATALIGYAIGLWSFSGVRIIVRAFYATGDMKTPVLAALAGLLTNLAISALLSSRLGVFALAFGISAGSLVNQVTLFVRLKGLVGRFPWEIFGNAPKVLLHSLVLLAVVRFLWLLLEPVLPSGMWPLLLSLLGLIGAGALLYGALTTLSGVTESRLLYERIAERLQRKKR
ncbi:MAG: murein biosynthesis integral membrane protein MurJ [Nitrospirae bacterium]|nr:murein biosynthesis integral membrane protein MurJ [Nitrospirota bacterium]